MPWTLDRDDYKIMLGKYSKRSATVYTYNSFQDKIVGRFLESVKVQLVEVWRRLEMGTF